MSTEASIGGAGIPLGTTELFAGHETMSEPTLTCPTCRTEIKLTESLAAPLIEDTRRRYEDQLARKEAEVAGREAAIRERQAQIAAARDTIDAQVAASTRKWPPSSMKSAAAEPRRRSASSPSTLT
jgi:hypothetical protein